MGVKVEMIGLKFNRLTVLAEMPNRASNGGYMYECLCDCGNKSNVRADSLRNGHIMSCGCYNSDATTIRFTKHGHNTKKRGQSPEYQVWHAMTQRCLNPNCESFKDYGGRGIQVCDKWLKFEGFLEDMGYRPSKNHTLDRYPNNDGNYELINCRWATEAQQARNKRSNVWLEYNGRKEVISDWAKELKTYPSVIKKMMSRGKSFEKVVLFYKRKNK